MSLQATLVGIFTIASGVVLGTILTWIASYFIGKRALPKLIKSLGNDPEVIKAIQALMKKSEVDQNKQA